MNDATPTTLEDLFPDLPAVKCRYQIDVSIPRSGRDTMPAENQAIADVAAVILLARGWSRDGCLRRSVLSMVADAADCADALDIGAQVARALGAGTGAASVSAEPMPSR